MGQAPGAVARDGSQPTTKARRLRIWPGSTETRRLRHVAVSSNKVTGEQHIMHSNKARSPSLNPPLTLPLVPLHPKFTAPASVPGPLLDPASGSSISTSSTSFTASALVNLLFFFRVADDGGGGFCFTRSLSPTPTSSVAFQSALRPWPSVSVSPPSAFSDLSRVHDHSLSLPDHGRLPLRRA